MAPCFIDIRHSSRNKKDRDIDPIGRFSYHAIVGVKENGDQHKSEEDSAELDAPKIFAIPEKEALHDGIDKHRPKEELHMLPSGFVDTRKRRDPRRLTEPVV